jgi:hypothetical protein
VSEAFDALLAEVRVAHQIPGRVRLKLVGVPAPLRAQLKPETLARFFAGLAEIPGIRQVRLNALAKSCTLEYDTHTLSDAAWRELFAPADASPLSGAAQRLREGVRQSYRQASGGDA